MNDQHEAATATVPGLFQLRASQTPRNTAISTVGSRVTYAELAQWSDAVAEAIASMGIPAGAAIAVSLEKSPAYVASILGILKAGCCYVPLDPAYPMARREFILHDCGASALIGSWSGDTVPVPQIPVLDPGRSVPAGAATLPAPGPADGAAVFYTSGSTGIPKGVLVQHHQIVALARNDERVRIAPGERVPMIAPLAFDASTFEVWNTLGGGGEVVILDRESDSIQELSKQLRLHHLDCMFLTSGLFHLLAEHNPAAFDSVGKVLTGGDVLSPKYVQRIAARRTVRVYAAYGPTETTTYASLHEVLPGEAMDNVPIGRPLAGVTMRILDDALRPVPPGEPGELYIGGCGVAAGYLGNPAISAARFVADIAGCPPGERMYRTGDLAMQRPDGVFEFRGRVDRQVKIRGHRVEPAEIEAHLASYPLVAATAVRAIADSSGVKRLVAYVVPVPGRDFQVAGLRTWLAGRLPGYLQPASYLVLPEIPLDPHGKRDLKKLPDPWIRRDQLTGLAPFAAPRGSREEFIAKVWAESLGLDQVGLDDDFYVLGGDSLRSIDMMARMRHQGVEVSATTFFRNPTIRELSAAFDAEGTGSPAT